MIPLKSTCDSVSCLEALVGVKSECIDPSKCPDYFIEDIDGVTIKSLANLADNNSPSGIMYAKSIIRAAAKEMMSDIELLVGNGYAIKESFGDVCSDCNFSPNIYQAGGGTLVRNTIVSPYSAIRVFRLEVAAEFTGTTTVVFNDGIAEKLFSVSIQAGEYSIVDVDYFTSQKTVKIYFQDLSIRTSKITCATTSSCGCGGNMAPTTQSIRYEGIIGQASAPNQYGFKICAAVVCSNDIMVCNFIKQVPKLFGAALLYRVGAKYYSRKRISTRNNENTQDDGDINAEMEAKYMSWYEDRLNGTPINKGINSFISNSLSSMRDSCVICNGVRKTGWAMG